MITNNIACVAGGSCEQPILGGGGTIFFHRDLRGNSRVGKPRVKFPSAAHQSPLPRLLTDLHAASSLTFTISPPKQKHLRAKSRQLCRLLITEFSTWTEGGLTWKRKKEVNRNRKRLSRKQRHSPLRISEHEKHGENLNKSREEKKNGNF